MLRLVRGAEGLHGILLILGLLGPLLLFFAKAGPWRSDISVALAEPSIRSAIFNSLILAATSSILSTSLAFIFSWLLWRYEWPRGIKSALSLALKIPYLLPAFFFAIGWIALAAPNVGYLNRLMEWLGGPALPSIYGIGGTIFVFTLWLSALAMIQLQVFFTQFPGHLEDAAILCGASPIRTFFQITFPLAHPHLLSCVLLTAVSALAAFGVPAILGAPARSYVLTTRIYQSIKSAFDFSQAGLLSLILLAMTAVVLILQQWLARSTQASLVTGKASRPSPLVPSFGAKCGLGFAGLFAVFSCLLPCVAVAVQSLLRDRSDLTSWTFDKYLYVFTQLPDGVSALRNSLVTSTIAAATATLLGLLLAYGATRLGSRASRMLSAAWDIGYALPGTVIALSLLVFFSGTLANTIWILVVAYIVKYAAFALRTLTPAMAGISKELEEAAWMSGASPRRGFFRIILPILRPAIAAAVLLAFIPMLSELTMSVFLAGAGTETLGTLIYRLQEYADPGSAAVLAVVVALATLVINTLLKKFSKGTFGI